MITQTLDEVQNAPALTVNELAKIDAQFEAFAENFYARRKQTEKLRKGADDLAFRAMNALVKVGVPVFLAVVLAAGFGVSAHATFEVFGGTEHGLLGLAGLVLVEGYLILGPFLYSGAEGDDRAKDNEGERASWFSLAGLIRLVTRLITGRSGGGAFNPLKAVYAFGLVLALAGNVWIHIRATLEAVQTGGYTGDVTLHAVLSNASSLPAHVFLELVVKMALGFFAPFAAFAGGHFLHDYYEQLQAVHGVDDDLTDRERLSQAWEAYREDLIDERRKYKLQRAIAREQRKAEEESEGMVAAVVSGETSPKANGNGGRA